MKHGEEEQRVWQQEMAQMFLQVMAVTDLLVEKGVFTEEELGDKIEEIIRRASGGLIAEP